MMLRAGTSAEVHRILLQEAVPGAGFQRGQIAAPESTIDPERSPQGGCAVFELLEAGRVVARLEVSQLAQGIPYDDAIEGLRYAVDAATLRLTNMALLARQAEENRIDVLTELPNRRAFEERLAEELRRSARSRRSFALVLLDIDGLQHLNLGGRQTGDAALRGFAAALRAECRSTDFPARVEDDDFALILVDVDRTGAERMVSRLLEATLGLTCALPYRISACAGSAGSFAVDTAETLTERANAALRDAKRSGRGNSRFT